MYLGLDRPQFPGITILRSLRASTPLSFVALPLTGDAAARWRAAAPNLRDHGWGFAPLYHSETSDGATDALAAAELAYDLGLGSASVIYLDIRGTGHPGYVAAWAAEMRDSTAYWPGLRCSHQFAATRPEMPAWIRNAPTAGRTVVDPSATAPPSPARSGYPAAIAWQYRESNPGPLDLVWLDNETEENVRLSQVGLISSVVRDPANSISDAIAS
jgi:hypothetical protein